MSPQVFIHIGFGKTASTTLQQSLFDRHPEIECIGQPRNLRDEHVQQMIHVITDRETVEFDRHFNAFVASHVAPLLATSRQSVVLSEEALATGSSLPGLVGRRELADRLKRLFPDARIIVVLRDQLDIIPSWYAQQQRAGRHRSTDFDSWLQESWDALETTSVFQLFNYATLLQLYSERFGRDNLCVLRFELFREQPERFVAQLASFMGIDVAVATELMRERSENSRVTDREMWIRRLASRLPVVRTLGRRFGLQTGIQAWAAGGESLEFELSDAWKKRLRSYYAEENRRLATEFELPWYGLPDGHSRAPELLT